MRKAVTLAICAACAFPSVAYAEPSDEEVNDKLAFIERRLDAGTAEANRWSYAWFTTFGTLAVGQFGVALGVKDPGFRADMAVGAVSSAFGVLPFALLPFTPRFAASQLAAWPERTPEERRKKLVRAEELLKKSAEVERLGHGWVPQIAGIGVSVGFGLVLSLGYNRIRTGMMNTAVGIALVETQIFTQPTTAIDDWNDYQKGSLHGARHSHGTSIAIVPSPGGINIAGAF